MSSNGEQESDLKVRAAIAHHVSSYDKVCGERDDLQKLVDRQEQLLKVAKIEIESLRSELAIEQSRTGSYQTERDDAVIRAATLLEALNHIKTLSTGTRREMQTDVCPRGRSQGSPLDRGLLRQRRRRQPGLYRHARLQHRRGGVGIYPLSQWRQPCFL